MENTIFRREDNTSDEPKTGSLKKIFNRKRRDQKPLITYFNDYEKSKIIKNIFKRNVKQFDDFMTELDRKTTWQEAYILMEEELKRRKIDIISQKARDLTDRIYQVFFPDDISIKF